MKSELNKKTDSWRIEEDEIPRGDLYELIVTTSYAIYHKDKKTYPYDTLRILTYDWTQWKLLIVMSFINSFNIMMGFIAF